MIAIYPLLAVLLLWGAKLAPRGEFHRDFSSVKSDLPLRGFFMLVIVLHHVSQQLNHPGSMRLFMGVGILCVSTFFYQSGYGLTKQFHAKDDYFHHFFRHRFLKLAPPFLLCNLIFLLTDIGLGASYTPGYFLKCLVGVVLINTHAWFILTISLFYAVFYLVFRLFERPAVRYGLLTVFWLSYTAFCLYRGSGLQLFEGAWWFNSSSLFFLGIWAGDHDRALTVFLKKNYRPLTLLSVPVFLLFYGFSVYVTNAFPYPANDPAPLSVSALTSWFDLLWQTLAVVSFCLMVTLFSMKLKCSNAALRFLGSISLELYLIHGLFIHLFKGQLITIKSDVLFVAAVLSCSLLAASLLYGLLRRCASALEKAQPQ
ncbi:MAG: acyltransferase [Eubacteriales bacterium]|nr:acyltransferase [Eubacteriales bacterium]